MIVGNYGFSELPLYYFVCVGEHASFSLSLRSAEFFLKSYDDRFMDLMFQFVVSVIAIFFIHLYWCLIDAGGVFQILMFFVFFLSVWRECLYPSNKASTVFHWLQQ